MLTLTTNGQRVAIAGQVIDANTKRPIAGARVELTVMPASLQQRLQLKALQYGDRWEGLPERGDRTRTAPDGLFYFTGLPEGDYTLVATAPLPRNDRSSSRTVTVASGKPSLQALEIGTAKGDSAPEPTTERPQNP